MAPARFAGPTKQLVGGPELFKRRVEDGGVYSVAVEVSPEILERNRSPPEIHDQAILWIGSAAENIYPGIPS